MAHPENCDANAALKLSSFNITTERIKSIVASIPSSSNSYRIPNSPNKKLVKSLPMPSISGTDLIGIALVNESSKSPNPDAPKMTFALNTNGEARAAT